MRVATSVNLLGMSRWLDKHLEDFVRPKLGKIPNPVNNVGYVWTPAVLDSLHVHWEAAKKWAEGRTIIMPGRDTFEWSVLAQIEGFTNFVFRPDISALTCHYVAEDYSKGFAIDSGLSGSVPRALGIEKYRLASCYRDPVNHQLINPLGKLISICSYLEGAPKYWDRAQLPLDTGGLKKLPEGKFYQPFSNESMFEKAAGLTQFIANDAAPRMTKTKPVDIESYHTEAWRRYA